MLGGFLHDWLESLQALFNRAVEILLGECFSGGCEHCDLFYSNFNSSLHAFHVGHQAGIGNSLFLIDVEEQFLGAGHLRHPLGRDKRAHFHDFEAGLRKAINQFGFVLQADNLLLVLEPIAWAHFHNLDKLPQPALMPTCVLRYYWALH